MCSKSLEATFSVLLLLLLAAFCAAPEKARAVLSELQAAYPVQKLPADIENRTIPGGPSGT